MGCFAESKASQKQPNSLKVRLKGVNPVHELKQTKVVLEQLWQIF